MKTWNSEELFNSGDAYFASIREAIIRAHATIDFETFIFENDRLGEEITHLLQEAAQRGVFVRLSVDGVGAMNYNPHRFIKNLDPYFQIRVFRPVLFKFKFHRTKKSLLARFLSWLRVANRRNHRKICIVDGKIAYVGSMNISEVHSEKFRKERAWRDTGIRVEGDEVKFLNAAFDRVWRKTVRFGIRRNWVRTWIFRTPIRVRGRASLVRLNDRFRIRKRHYQDLLLRIAESKTRVWMTNAYFAPEMSLLRALRMAAWTGSDVRLLLPRKTDVWIFRWVTPLFYYFLLNAGVRIFEYSPRVLHAKTLLIDQWALVGSSNLNHRSLIHDLEVDIIISKPQTRKELESQFLNDLTQSREVQISELKSRSRLGNTIGKITLLLRRWI